MTNPETKEAREFWERAFLVELAKRGGDVPTATAVADAALAVWARKWVDPI
jgi:hypothetical protein